MERAGLKPFSVLCVIFERVVPIVRRFLKFEKSRKESLLARLISDLDFTECLYVQRSIIIININGICAGDNLNEIRKY